MPANRSAIILSTVLIAAALAVLWGGAVPAATAQTIQVLAADPPSGAQGTINLNVLIKGRGFKTGAIARFYRTGTFDPDGIVVKSTTYRGSTELIANIDIADWATLSMFDIEVMNVGGRTGKGTELFKVIYNQPDPAIAYIVGSVFNGDLTVMNADGMSIQMLVSEAELQNSSPNWSPDGSQLVFVRDDGFYEGWIYVVDKDGSNLHEVIHTMDYSFADTVWSPQPFADGQYKILFRDAPTSSNGDLYVVNLDGTGLANLTDSTGFEEFFYPSWDPSATRIVAQAYNAALEKNIVVFDVAPVDSVLRAIPSINLTAEGPLQDAGATDPSWANTQDKILVSAFLPGESYWSLWVINLNDPYNPSRLSQVYSSNPLMADWSPDDSKLAYRRAFPKRSKEKSGIFIINANGSGAPGTYMADGNWPDWRRCCPTCDTACAP
ncbi:MAG: translocation protein TolB [Proteobacteria bacterium]|nr:translocation protein TolB [Pseudomonadota bacterium]